jgi:hypothetical protein
MRDGGKKKIIFWVRMSRNKTCQQAGPACGWTGAQLQQINSHVPKRVCDARKKARMQAHRAAEPVWCSVCWLWWCAHQVRWWARKHCTKQLWQLWGDSGNKPT